MSVYGLVAAANSWNAFVCINSFLPDNHSAIEGALTITTCVTSCSPPAIISCSSIVHVDSLLSKAAFILVKAPAYDKGSCTLIPYKTENRRLKSPGSAIRD